VVGGERRGGVWWNTCHVTEDESHWPLKSESKWEHWI